MGSQGSKKAYNVTAPEGHTHSSTDTPPGVSNTAAHSTPTQSSSGAAGQTQTNTASQSKPKAGGNEGSPSRSSAGSGADPTDFVVAEVGDVNDLEEGQMKEVQVGDIKALLVKDGGQYHAIGAKCTHYGAPLAKGALGNGHVRCPWHGACFNIRTGDIEDFPGLDSVQKFEVEVVDGKVKVKCNPKLQKSNKRQKQMSCHMPDNGACVLIIGGGAASVTCAETLRQEGFNGKVVIATKESCLPYDRPKLSKALDLKPEQAALRDANFYSVYDIDIKLNKEAVEVDTVLKTVKFKDDETINYDQLLIATGGSPRTLPVPGSDLENVCVLRTPEDGKKIADAARDKDVVIIGTSFIGMEIAACLAGKARSVTSLDIVDIPFKPVLGEKVGLALKKMHEDKGTKFIGSMSAKEFVGENGKLKEVILQDDTRLPADVCIMGVGVFPTTAFLKDSGIDISDRGFINVDKHMKTNKDNVFAAGDIVQFPLFLNGDSAANVQHWQMAHAHGRIAALNMLNQNVEVKSVPYFWTQQFGKSIRYTGYGFGYDDIIVHGNLDELQFVAFYTKGDNVIAVASMNMDPIVSQASEVLLAGKTITKDEIRDDPKAFLTKLKS